MDNPYLVAQRKKYDALVSTIKGLQTRAVEESRDLTDDELRSIEEQSDAAKKIAGQIESLTEVETRSIAVAKLAATLVDDTNADNVPGRPADGAQTRAKGSTQTRDRDPGHYVKDGANSFFGDMYRSKTDPDNASDARTRLAEHTRALSTGTNGPGVVPPHWMTEEFELLARQGRQLANAVRHIDLGDDPRPITLPKQIAGTDAVVAEQASENTAVGGADAWDSDVDVVTPKPTAGKQLVSRQLLDMSSPAVDQLIYGDLISVYNQKVEAKVATAMLTDAGAALGPATFATEAAFTTLGAATDGVITLAIAVRNARKLPANILAMSVTRYGEFLKLKDNTGRPLIPSETAGPMNVAGIGEVAVDGRIEGLGVIASDGIGIGGKPDKFFAARSTDTVLFESNLLRFRFEEQAGPESIVLGIWGYTAVIVRQAGKSIKRGEVTA